MSFLVQPITLQSLFGKDRMVGEITVNVIINESTNDVLTITKQPVQQGASITDHAYKEPTVLSMTAHLRDNSIGAILSALNPFGGGGILSSLNPFGSSGLTGLAKLYDDLLTLQSSRVPFDVITPKRLYKNMLMSSLGVTTDKATENILAVNFSFQQIVIVSVTTVDVPRSRQKFPDVTGAIQNAGKKSSFLKTGSQAVGALFSRGA